MMFIISILMDTIGLFTSKIKR